MTPALALHGTAPVLAELSGRLRASGRTVSQIASLAPSLGSATDSELLVVHAIGRIPPELARLSPARAGRLILFVEQPVEEDVLSLTTTLGAIVLKQGAFGVDELQLAIDKLLDPRPLGIERYLPDHTPVQRIILHRSSERGEALMLLDRYVTALSIDPRRISQILTVADEFVTNAFYHAPVDGIGGHPYSHMSRMDPIQSHPNRPVELCYASSATRVAVGVRDLYGSLDQTSVRAHLARVIANPKANFKVSSSAQGGAGLGLINAVRGASQVIFNIIPGQLTECVGVLETAGNYRKFLEEGRSLQLYSIPATALS